MNIQVSISEMPWMSHLKTFLYSYMTGTSSKGKLLIIGRKNTGRVSFGRIFRKSSISEDPLIDEVVVGQKHFDLHHLESLKDVHVWEHSDVNAVICFLCSSDVSTLGDVREDLDELKNLLSKSPQVPILVLDHIQDNQSCLSKDLLMQELKIADNALSEISSLVDLTVNAIGFFQVNLTSLEGVEEAREWLHSKIC